MYGKLSKEAESQREQCSKEVGRQLEIVVGSVAHGIAQYCVEKLQLADIYIYAVTLPTKAAADKAVSALPERMLMQQRVEFRPQSPC